MMSTRRFGIAAVTAALLLAACASAPTAPIPEPLPEREDWSLATEGGAFLGLEVRENDSGSLDDLSFEPGVRVTAVADNSPAAKAGFEPGDVVLTFEGVELFDPGALEQLVSRSEPASPAVLEVRRGDSVYDVTVELTARDAGASRVALDYRVDPSRTLAGWRSTPAGVQLAASAPDAPCLAAGLAVGDVVTALDDEPVHSARDLIRRVQGRRPGERARFTVRGPQGGERSVTVRLHDVPRVVTRSSVPILWTYDAEADGSAAKFVVLDFWLFSVFRYERQGRERLVSLFSLFDFATGEGELTE